MFSKSRSVLEIEKLGMFFVRQRNILEKEKENENGKNARLLLNLDL